MKIRVLKADGTAEPYLHTKVLGTFHNALTLAEQWDLPAAEQMAEAVTFYIYRTGSSSNISSDRIHLMVQSVLSSAGFPDAADDLNQYRLNRRLLRRRLEVISGRQEISGWSKSRVAKDLIREAQTDRLTARAIAGAVEEKVLRMGLTRVHTSLLRELVRQDTQAILQAEKQLAAVL